MDGVTLKAVDPTAEDHLVRSPEIAAIPGMAAGLASTRFMDWRPRPLDFGFRRLRDRVPVDGLRPATRTR